MTDPTTIVTRSYHAIEGADWDALDELFSPDCEMVDPATSSANLDQMQQTFRAYHQAFTDLTFDVERTVASGDTVVVESTIRGVHTGPLTLAEGDLAATGRPIAVRACEVLRISDGRIVSSHIYYDQAEFLTQLGVLEAVASA